MSNTSVWVNYPITYRAKEMAQLIQWIRTDESGSVVGLVGCGRSNLLGFLCHRPDVLQHYLGTEAARVILVPVEIYDLPINDLSNLYRTMLYAFYWIRERFSPDLQQAITDLYMENRALHDPFLTQKALYELMRIFQHQNFHVVMVLNRFDRFCEVATPAMINTLRSLRDNFKEMLSYIAGMIQEVLYLPDPAALGDMYELLDTRVCWVGAMSETDARTMLGNVLRSAATPPTAEELQLLLDLSGRFPSLLKAVGQWWLMNERRSPRLAEWCDYLLAQESVQYRIDRLWHGLTQEEKLALSELQKGEWVGAAQREAQRQLLMARLEAKGLCRRKGAKWEISGDLLATYIARMEGRVRGKLWLDEQARSVYQGKEVVEGLTALQFEILRFLIRNPRTRHTRDDIIDNAWPEDDQREGITPNALQVHIASIRKKIEPNPALPRYLLTWHGKPGGYQFFPEGKPE